MFEIGILLIITLLIAAFDSGWIGERDKGFYLAWAFYISWGCVALAMALGASLVNTARMINKAPQALLAVQLDTRY